MRLNTNLFIIKVEYILGETYWKLEADDNENLGCISVGFLLHIMKNVIEILPLENSK